MKESFDFIIVGAGIFGLSTAHSLRQRGYAVCVLNHGVIPDPLAAGTDISKIVRMEYGSDREYMDMAARSIPKWREWNRELGEEIYHEVGFILLAPEPMDGGRQAFESDSFAELLKRGYAPMQLDPEKLISTFPAFNSEYFNDGFFHSIGGYVRSGRVVELLTSSLKSKGVTVRDHTGVAEIEGSGEVLQGVILEDGSRVAANQIIVCAGTDTPRLVPDLAPYFRTTGHPVFHLNPANPELFTPPKFACFSADISNSGWYGFPLYPEKGIVKIANHGVGLVMDPRVDEGAITPQDEESLRDFLSGAIPSLENSPIVYFRRCCYTDTLDGHFWISRHPTIQGLTIGSGGSGHGFKMGPEIGEMIAKTALGEDHGYSNRYAWRHLDRETQSREEARSKS